MYFFGHREPSIPSKMISLHMAGGLSLQLSPTHFIPTCTYGCDDATAALTTGGGKTKWVYKYASAVIVGDIVKHVPSATHKPTLVAVESINETLELGLFNPYVRGANIVVNNIVASPHSEWVLDGMFPAPVRGYLPHLYELIFTPLYAIYLIVGPVISQWLAEDLGLSQADSGKGYAALVGTAFGLPAVIVAALLVTHRKLCVD